MNASSQTTHIRQQLAYFNLLTALLRALPKQHPARRHAEGKLFAPDFDEDSDFGELFQTVENLIAEHRAAMLALP